MLTNPQSDHSAEYLSVMDVARRYSVHRLTPWRWLKTDPTFPKPVKLGAMTTRWRRSDLDAWETAKAESPAA